MNRTRYRYEFEPEVSLHEVEESIALAILAAEGVHGEAQVRLDAGYAIDEPARACLIDASTAVGETIARVFTGFLRKEFGEDAFRVERVAADDRPLRRSDGASRPEGVRR